jgi:hypothetical protein
MAERHLAGLDGKVLQRESNLLGTKTQETAKTNEDKLLRVGSILHHAFDAADHSPIRAHEIHGLQRANGEHPYRRIQSPAYRHESCGRAGTVRLTGG